MRRLTISFIVAMAVGLLPGQAFAGEPDLTEVSAQAAGIAARFAACMTAAGDDKYAVKDCEERQKDSTKDLEKMVKTYEKYGDQAIPLSGGPGSYGTMFDDLEMNYDICLAGAAGDKYAEKDCKKIRDTTFKLLLTMIKDHKAPPGLVAQLPPS